MNRSERRRRKKLSPGAGKDFTPPQAATTHKQVSVQEAFLIARRYHADGNLATAENLYQQILQQTPDHTHTLCMLGVLAQQSGDSERALALISRAIELDPDFAGAHNNLGEVLRSLGRLAEAKAGFEKAIELEPDFAEAHNNLGTLFKQIGRLDIAGKCFSTAIALKADYADPFTNLGNVFDDHGRYDQAIAHHKSAIAINPRHALAHRNLGKVLHEVGRLDEAMDSYRTALACDPDGAEVYRLITRIKRFDCRDDDIQAMEQAYARSGPGDETKMHLAFALGKAFEDLRDYETAFMYLDEANRLQNASFDYDVRNDEANFNRIKAVFTEALFSSRDGAGLSDATPVFILGMPRSGTTLVEQILASHPDVHGAGELTALLDLVSAMTIDATNRYPENVWQLENVSFRNIAAYYLEKLRERAPDAPRITDKMPGNFQHIGLIRLILPKAKIIHCTRSPMDTCLSIYKNHFAVDGHYYACNLVNLGRYYTLYSDLMDHWRTVLPGFVHDIRYEDLVADKENRTRELLEFCDLEWNPACLNFHRTDRAVNTASATQVRQPIYRDSVQSWKNYDKQLAPLRAILEP